MAKLVLLSGGLAGTTCELRAERITIGRLGDNSFQIAEPSISSHHCEILLRGNDVVIKDLNSTNGTFIDGVKFTEAALKPGQILRLGQVDMRLEVASPPPLPRGPKRDPSPRRSEGALGGDTNAAYNLMADKIGGVPNLRKKDNLYQALCALGFLGIGVTVGSFWRGTEGMLIGALVGLVAGLLVSGGVLMVIGLMRKP